MAKTLVVKLAGTVDNDDLRKLGEMRIQITPISKSPEPRAPSSNSQLMSLTVAEPIQLKLTGDGHFTDSTLEQDLGTTFTLQAGNNRIYVSDSTSTLHIYNKSAITAITLPFDGTNHHLHWEVDYADFAGMYALTNIDLHYVKVTADSSLSAVRDLTKLTNLKLMSGRYTQCKGDLSDVVGLTRLNILNLIEQNQITGNISSLAGLTNLTAAYLSFCSKLTGDTSSIAHLHPNNGGKLASFNYDNTGITGSWPPATA